MSIRVLLYGANASGDSRPAGFVTTPAESPQMMTAPASKLTRMLLSLIPLVRTHPPFHRTQRTGPPTIIAAIGGPAGMAADSAGIDAFHR
jgi:hypothetical protein